MELATNHKPHTNFRYLSFAQVTELLSQKDIELRKWRTKCSNLVKQVGTCIRKLADYRRFAIAAAESNLPQLSRLISVGLRNGASPRALTNLLHDVFDGVQVSITGAILPSLGCCATTADPDQWISQMQNPRING
ncbi:hypothetical protein C8J57DRAFT_1474550 [Mycena rebaudengoi]|nr:hypothetical protein C8J57DRAFT_1474550 [Mycena rebaudengoi]